MNGEKCWEAKEAATKVQDNGGYTVSSRAAWAMSHVEEDVEKLEPSYITDGYAGDTVMTRNHIALP